MNNRYHKDLSDRNKWICEKSDKLIKKYPRLDLKQIYIKVSIELNEKYPLLWVNWETVRHIHKRYGYYKRSKNENL